ncbi:MAG: glycosyltransferase [Bacteroidota bacterium]|nr:glycosyltransferase [Bacteroidota bacterium]
MSKSEKTCILFTNSFPYGHDENFIEKEVPFLSKYFEKVEIYSLNTSHETPKVLPSNVSMISWQASFKFSSRQLIIKHWILLIKVFYQEFKHQPKHTLSSFRGLLSDFLHQIRRAESMINALKKYDISSLVLYSYWMDRWASVLSIVKHYHPQFDFISRAHAFDLYEEDNRNAYIKFRKFQFQNIKHVYTVSHHGEDYLKLKYPQWGSKISTAYLGVIQHDFVNAMPDDKELKIVSCGSVQDRKRIKEIPQILSQLNTPFHWIHFGDGGEMDLLISNIKKHQIEDKVTLMGHVQNDVFLSYLKNEPVSFFLSLSRNEGLPYTMMEAISFGIPIIATDAMGCREICTVQTGILLPLNDDSKSVSQAIEKFAQSTLNTEAFRTGVKNFWKENFEAENNNFKFYKKIENTVTPST